MCRHHCHARREGAEVQDVFAYSYAQYRQTHIARAAQEKAAQAIIGCRTAAMGGHVQVCSECGNISICYNSCRNRHCPKCGASAKEKWLDGVSQMVLDIPHFHVVFTVPQELNRIALANGPPFYNLMFHCVRDTLATLCADSKHLGALTGFTCVLHTWGQNLSFHPHIHVVITAGGLSPDGGWVDAKRTKEGKSFFIPGILLAASFRGRMLAGLRRLHADGQIDFDDGDLDRDIRSAGKKQWVSYCKEPFAGTQGVYNYLGKYTHRTAISNGRIRCVTETHTTFDWRDYSDGNRIKTMTLDNVEFIRRFLMHVLPGGFMRIRHYGLYASSNQKTKLAEARLLLNMKPLPPAKERVKLTVREAVLKIAGVDISLCPHCGGRMYTRRLFKPGEPAMPAAASSGFP